jgi:hypothetical protein
VNPSAAAFWETAIQRVGVAIQIQRVSGFAPNTVVFAASISAVVRKVAPDGAAPSRDGMSASEAGAITQDDRSVVLLQGDLEAARFPLPLRKGDLVILPAHIGLIDFDADQRQIAWRRQVGAVWFSETFNVTNVDPYRLAIAGAIELTVTGVT